MYFTVAFRIHISIYVSQKLLTGLSHSSVVFPMHDEINQSNNDDKYHQQMKLSELNNQSNDDDRYYQQIKLLE